MTMEAVQRSVKRSCPSLCVLFLALSFTISACAAGQDERSSGAAGGRSESEAAPAGGGAERDASGSDSAAGSGESAGDGSSGRFQLDATAEIDEGAEYDSPELQPQFQGQSPPAGAGRSFETDFSRAAISFDRIISGGPPKDGIPAIDDPSFVSTESAGGWLEPEEPVLVFSVPAEQAADTGNGGSSAGGAGKGGSTGGSTRGAATDGNSTTHIYPLRILMYHEIVNDRVGGVPVTVTYCPLCNSGVAFHRLFDGRLLDFGTTGRLRYSNLIMYDRQTETWWQQATGRGLTGRYAGGRLELLPTLLLSWKDARMRYPEARVLSRETGHNRPYGRNPYGGYDTSDSPFLYRGPDVDERRDPLSRVLTLYVDDSQEAVSYESLQQERVVSRTVGGREVVVFWQPGTASALDAGTVAAGRDVGTANAFFAQLGGEPLSFEYDGEAIVDTRTGSEWNASGTAVSGELAGSSLEPVTSIQHFWFSWAAFRDTSLQ